MIALAILALLLGFALGIAWDHQVASLLRQRSHPDPEGSLRHTVDHVCQPPFSSWTQGFVYCFVADYDHKHIRPGDVWVCPECSATWMVERGEWQQKESAIP